VIKFKRSHKTALALIGGLAVVGLSLGVSGPANALGTKHPACGNGSYLASSTTSYAQSEQYNNYVCGLYYARAKYTYDGTTLYYGYVMNATDAVANPGYKTVSAGSHYTDDSGVVST
jgi:hypothetical protein